MSEQDTVPSSGESDEVTRLVAGAQALGDPDAYSGKRSRLRYSAGMHLEVTTDPAIPGNEQVAIMHNASGGGLSFWLKDRLEPGSRICVREFSGGQSTRWLRGRVRHCTMGIRGFLVGAAFDDPAPAAGDGSSAQDFTPGNADMQ